MLDRPTAHFPLGLEQEGPLLRGALLSYRKEGPLIERLFEIPYSSEEGAVYHANPLLSLPTPLGRDRLRQLLLVTGMPSTEVLVRSLEIKLSKLKDIDAVLAFQAEPLIPYPIEQAVLTREILASREGETQLTLFITRKDQLQRHLDLYHQVHLEPEAISCVPVALARFSQQYAQTTELHCIVHLGALTTTCLLAEAGKVVAAYSVPQAIGQLFTTAAGSPLALPDLLEQIRHSAPLGDTSALQTLSQAVGRTLFALTKQTRGREVPSILFTGEGCTIPGLMEELAKRFNKHIVPLATPEAQEPVSPEVLARYAIPVGLALGYLPQRQESINFRLGEFSYPNPWKRLKIPIAAYVIASLVIALMLWLVGDLRLAAQKQEIRAQYAALLNVLNKGHQSFELELQGKPVSPETLAQTPITPFNSLSDQEISSRLDFIQRDIQNTPDIFPLNPNIPRVSDLLAWLSSHPHTVNRDPQKDQINPLIQIESLHYTMVRHPERSKPRDHYEVKVELEFTSSQPKYAREFHDALLSPNDIVDPKGEVSWSSAQGRYRTTFFLKDRTVYP